MAASGKGRACCPKVIETQLSLSVRMAYCKERQVKKEKAKKAKIVEIAVKFVEEAESGYQSAASSVLLAVNRRLLLSHSGAGF